MFKIFKSKKSKTILLKTLVCLMVFSLAAPTVSAAVAIPGIITQDAKVIADDIIEIAEADAPVRAVPMPVPEPFVTGGMAAPDDGVLEEGLAEALAAVKQYFDIDEEKYTEFNWHYSPGDGVFSPNTWNLIWNSSDWNANVNAQVTEGGIVLYYYKYEWTPESGKDAVKLAKISKSGAKRTADGFLEKILGGEFEKFRLSGQSLGFPSERHQLNYVFTHNGFDYPNYTVNVGIDKLTGEIVEFMRRGHQFFHDLSGGHFSFDDASSTITKAEALKAYVEKIGLDLVYSSHFNWQTRELRIQPVYKLKNNYSEFISAVDGSLVEIDFDIGPVYGSAMGGIMAESAENVAADDGLAVRARAFSPVEQAAIDRAADYITANEAIAALVKAFDLGIEDLDSYRMSTNLRADNINQEQYIWNINFSKETDMAYEWYSAAVDARDGSIISFSYSSSFERMYARGMESGAEAVELLYTQDEAKELAIKKIKEILPYDFDANFELVETSNQTIRPMPVSDGDKSPRYNFYFARKANGIQFENNSIYITFDNINGKISNYSLTWYEKAEFPALENIITPARAVESIADFSGYSIIYTSNGMTDDGKINVSLVYKFDDTVNVDPFDGKWLDWMFEEIKKTDAELPDYKDLAGHRSEEIVGILTENDIYGWGGGTFGPDLSITRGEFFNYLKFYINNSWSFTELGSSIFINPRTGLRDIDGTPDPDAGKIITKQEAMKIICEITGYGEIGSHHEIFAYPFDDEGSDAEYRGYIAIMKAFDIISGDDDGNFSAKSEMTKAEAAEVIYNIVMSLQ